MISIVLSERDFDYELQALTNSFFRRKKSVYWKKGMEKSQAGNGCGWFWRRLLPVSDFIWEQRVLEYLSFLKLPVRGVAVKLL